MSGIGDFPKPRGPLWARSALYSCLAGSFLLGSVYWIGPPMGETAAWAVFCLWILTSVAAVALAVGIWLSRP